MVDGVLGTSVLLARARVDDVTTPGEGLGRPDAPGGRRRNGEAASLWSLLSDKLLIADWVSTAGDVTMLS